MIDCSRIDHIICWNEQGDGVFINSKFLFESIVLPEYYDHSNMSSFRRQLNKYGFMIDQTSDLMKRSQCEYKHPLFKKGRLDLLCRLRKKKIPNGKAKFQGTNMRMK